MKKSHPLLTTPVIVGISVACSIVVLAIVVVLVMKLKKKGIRVPQNNGGVSYNQIYNETAVPFDVYDTSDAI